MQTPYQILGIAALALLFTTAPACQARGGQEDLPRLRDAAAAWLKEQAARQYPGVTAKVEMGALDARLRFPACDAPEFLLPATARLWTSGSLGVHCAAPKAWNFYLGYRIRLHGPALVARTPLAAGQIPRESDLETRQIDYERPPSVYLTKLPEGAALTRPIQADQAMTPEMLVMPEVIKAGKRVTVRFVGHGFRVTHEGVAQNSARVGEMARVKVTSGRIVTGVASADGEVEVTP